MTHKILILGATSAIAQSIAKIYASSNGDICLVARNANHLEFIAADLRLRGQGKVITYTADFDDVAQHASVLDYAARELPSIDTVIIAYGSLPNQADCERSYADAHQALHTNFLSVVSLLTHLANYFASQQHGTIAVIGSVAGDRGRKSNYVYGAAKGGLSIFLQGLRQRLAKQHINVLTIKPGFVDTPMTQQFKKGLLWSSPNYVAEKIVRAIAKKRSVIYVPFYWRYIMLIIKAIPERLFSKMNF